MCTDFSSGASGSPGAPEPNTPKKRRITGTKRIEFEAAYAKVSQWLASVEMTASSKNPLKDDDDEDDLEAHFRHVTSVEAEMLEWKSKVHDTMTLGRDLISEIQSESDYPEDYLANIGDKVELISREMSRLETQVPETKRNLSYWRKKSELRSNLLVLSQVLDQYEAKYRDHCGREDDDGHDDHEMQLYKANLASHSQSLQHLKKLAKETLLHPGAVVDPGNTIKSDLYNFCERFEALEYKFSQNSSVPTTSSGEDQDRACDDDDDKSKSVAAAAGTVTCEKMKQCDSRSSVVDKDKDVIVVLQDVPLMEEQLKSIDNSQTTKNLLREMIQQSKRHQDHVEAITLWMQEVSVFLNAENALYGDIGNLEIQVKDSDALVEDIITLKSKLDEVNTGGRWLISKCTSSRSHDTEDSEKMHDRLTNQLKSVNETWDHVTSKSKSQNASLRETLERSRKLTESLDEITNFITVVVLTNFYTIVLKLAYN